MVDEQLEQKRLQELQRKADEARQKAFVEESSRLETETSEKAKELFQNLKSNENQLIQQKISQARAERQQIEDSLDNIEEEYRNKITAELQKKVIDRNRIEEERRKADEERLRKKAEDDERRRREDEIRRLEEERRQKLADEERKRQEQLYQQELEQQRHEEERERAEQEREQRIVTLINNAENYYNQNDIEHALVEIAKALVNDPNNPRALELEVKIKIARDEISPPPFIESEVEKPVVKKQVRKTSVGTIFEEEKSYKLFYVLGIVFILAIAVVMILLQYKKHKFQLPATIAVMPWTGASSSIEENILGASISEEVARRLGSTRSLFVLGNQSSRTIASHSKDPNREAFLLGYTYSLQGRVSRSENTITIDLKFVDSSGHKGWSERYVKSISDLAKLPSEITTQLVEALGIEKDDVSTGFTSAVTSTNSDAYQFYLRGRELFQHRTKESSENAYQLFLQSIQQDPKFAEGFASAAELLAYRLENGWSHGDSVIIQSKHLAEAAIRLNPQLDLGYIAIGKINAFMKKYNSALAVLDTAQALSPNNGTINLEKGNIYGKVGKYSDAINAFKDAYKYNIADPELLQNIAYVYKLAGSGKQGIPYMDAALKYVADSSAFIAVTLSDFISGDPDLRLSQCNRIIAASYRLINSNSGDYVTLYHLGRLRQIMGDTDAVEILSKTSEILQNELKKNPKDIDILTYLALTLTRLGRYADALALADKALAIDPYNEIIKYRVAQMYSVQMYVQKEKRLDDKKKDLAAKYLHEAVALNFRFDEITNTDFYNMFERPEFIATIQEQLK